ncbi:adult-specific rigid cuticular protein 15.7 [Caerostris extrusa]|uniref:Adult-specific rigid cuticular protein 15.7 n=1 Tax=Caerostris extrusa TaxID=172846 RepID=A0AAV4PJU6_CAEEX|nr:adult-specific rigid cuticular protein 15.7 [Caerostris extrusa]
MHIPYPCSPNGYITILEGAHLAGLEYKYSSPVSEKHHYSVQFEKYTLIYPREYGFARITLVRMGRYPLRCPRSSPRQCSPWWTRPPGQHWSQHQRPYSRWEGSYTITDIDGRARRVDYVADGHGFRASVKTNEPGTAASAPAAALINSPYAGPVAPVVNHVAPVAPVVAAPLAVAAPVAYGGVIGHGAGLGYGAGLGLGYGAGLGLGYGAGLGHGGALGLGYGLGLGKVSSTK